MTVSSKITSLDLKTFLTPPGRSQRRQWTPSSPFDSNSLDDDSKHRPRTMQYLRQPPGRSRSWNISERIKSSSSTSQLSLPLAVTPVLPSSSYRPRKSDIPKRIQEIICILVKGGLGQILVLVATIFLIVQCSSCADFATSTLQRLRDEESFRILQLHTIEQQSLMLHNSIRRRLHKAGMVVDDKNEEDDYPLESQRLQLEEMTNELDEQVTALRHEIQQNARKNIIQTYGEGPIKVVIGFEFSTTDESTGSRSAAATYESFGQKESSISILLYPDTPYTSWVWLEQIERNVWDGSTIEWDSLGGELHVSPSQPNHLERGLLEFVEYHVGKQTDLSDSSQYRYGNNKKPRNHEAWTVGLRQSILLPIDETGSQPEKGLEMFINLSNDQKIHKHGTCIGILIDGFDALQRLLMAMRRDERKFESVRINKISAMHIAHSELKLTNL